MIPPTHRRAGGCGGKKRRKDMTKEEILSNQAIDEHILFFHPLGKRPIRVDSENGIPGIKYVKERKGVQILDYGKAQFNFRAPDAKKVSLSRPVNKCFLSSLSSGRAWYKGMI